MTRRAFAPFVFVPFALVADPAKSVRGKLRQSEGQPPALEVGGKLIQLTGDEPTVGVLRDERLKDSDFEVFGTQREPATFEIDPIHTRSLFVHREGQRLMVTYWCDICYIRTYTPGDCWCCQENTVLDLRDPDAPERTP